MLPTLCIAIVIFSVLPLLAEIHMVIRSILAGCIGAAAARQKLQEAPFLSRLTLRAAAPHVQKLQREYGQYMRLQAGTLAAAGGVLIAALVLLSLRLSIPAAVLCAVFGVAAFGSIQLVHAHCGYDHEKRTTRYNRTGGK